MSPTDIKIDLLKSKQEAANKLLYPHGTVRGVGIGLKGVGGEKKDCVRIYVSDETYVACAGLVEKDYLGVPTHVIPVGRFGRSGGGQNPRKDAPTPQKDSPTRPGSPIRVKTTAPNVNEGERGTLGIVIQDGDYTPYILSCNHLLTVNGRVHVDSEAEVVSAEFVGDEKRLARPREFVFLDRNKPNSADCAVAALNHDAPVLPAFPDGTIRLNPNGAIYAEAGWEVEKVGAVTGHTTGTIVDVDADLFIDYSFGTFRFDHQVMIDGGYDDLQKLDKVFATAGDSGSAVLYKMQPTALIYAASGRFAVACPLRTRHPDRDQDGVLDLLEKQLKKPLTFVAG
jgi:hypothetical protein